MRAATAAPGGCRHAWHLAHCCCAASASAAAAARRPCLHTHARPCCQVAAEALRVCEQLVGVIRPAPPAPVAPDLAPVVTSMFNVINARLSAQDQDQEVKECAILGMAHLVATCADMLPAEVRAAVLRAQQGAGIAQAANASLRRWQLHAAVCAGRRALLCCRCCWSGWPTWFAHASTKRIVSLTCARGRLSHRHHVQVPGVLRLLLERLRNEITRVAAVKAFGLLAASKLELPLGPALEPAVVSAACVRPPARAQGGRLLHQARMAASQRPARAPAAIRQPQPLTAARRAPLPQAELTSFLRKANRQLRQAALATLEALVTQHGGELAAASASAIVAEAAGLVSDADLSTAALALRLCVALLKQQPAVAQEVADRVLPAGLCLVRSPLLQVRARRGAAACARTRVAGSSGARTLACTHGLRRSPHAAVLSALIACCRPLLLLLLLVSANRRPTNR